MRARRRGSVHTAPSSTVHLLALGCWPHPELLSEAEANPHAFPLNSGLSRLASVQCTTTSTHPWLGLGRAPSHLWAHSLCLGSRTGRWAVQQMSKQLQSHPQYGPGEHGGTGLGRKGLTSTAVQVGAKGAGAGPGHDTHPNCISNWWPPEPQMARQIGGPSNKKQTQLTGRTSCSMATPSSGLEGRGWTHRRHP